MVKPWWKSKTVWTGIGGVLIAFGSWLQGAMPPAEAIQLAITSLLAIFIRDGIGLSR